MITRATLVLVLLVGSAGFAGAGPWLRHTIDDSSQGADGVRLADASGDGLLDVVTGWEQGGVIRAYLNPGPQESKQRWPAVTVGQVNSPEDAVFVDLDGDGATDVVSSCEGRTRTMYVHWAPKERRRYLDATAWKTEPIPVTRQQQSWMFALPMHLDGRHGIDLIAGSKGSGATVGWLESPEDPRSLSAWRFHPLYKAGWIMSLQPCDMDDDGDRDVLVSDRKGPGRGVLWLENPGVGACAAGEPWKVHRIGADGREVMFLTSADLNRDGRRDVLAAVKPRGIVYLYSGGDPASPWREHEISMPRGSGTAKGVAVGDLDGDGRSDIVFTCEDAGGGRSGAGWLSYRESPTERVWQHHDISGPDGAKFDRIELVDMDADGDPDVLTCEESENLGVFWYENPRRPNR